MDTHSSEQTTVEIPVPRHLIGLLIGKNGETIQRLAAESGARLGIKQGE